MKLGPLLYSIVLSVLWGCLVRTSHELALAFVGAAVIYLSVKTVFT